MEVSTSESENNVFGLFGLHPHHCNQPHLRRHQLLLLKQQQCYLVHERLECVLTSCVTAEGGSLFPKVKPNKALQQNQF